jgi:DNA-binding CsgD family transcriptional regulator
LPSQGLGELLIRYYRGESDDELARSFGLKKTMVQTKRHDVLARIQRQISREDWLQDQKNRIDLSQLSDRQQTVIAAHLVGLSYQQIADQLGLERHDAWEALHVGAGRLMRTWLGTNAAALEKCRDRLSKQQYDACKWYLQDATTKEIAGELGVHQLSVSRLLDEAIIVLSRMAGGT